MKDLYVSAAFYVQGNDVMHELVKSMSSDITCQNLSLDSFMM